MFQADTVVSASTGLPGPIGIMLLIGALCGALGAFAADLATDAGKLERAKADTSGWALGFVGKMVVGAVAAIVILTVNPPGESWLPLIGTALVAGIGGDAIVVSFVATGRVDAAEQRTSDVVKAAVTQLDGVAQAVLAASSQAGGQGFAGAGPIQLVLETQIDTAKATLQSFLER